MRRHPWLSILAMVVVGACSATPASPGSASATPGAQPPTSQPAATGSSLFPIPGGFDIDRVRLMDPADLPDGLPVPVPFGGEIDTDVGVFEGEVLAVDYDPRFFTTAAAFYATWIELQDLDASPLIPVSGNAAGWEFSVDGEPMRIEITVSPDGAATQLRIYWG